MGYPYSFPVSASDFKGVISNPSASLCGNFINTLLKLPLLVYQFVSTLIDAGGNLTVTFMSMIFTPGDIKTSAAAEITSPVWLLCDGSEYAKTTYPDLYAAIGDIYGTAPWPMPSNSNNFRVPNYSCMSLAGVGSVSATVPTPPSGPPVGPFFVGHTYTIGGQYGEDDHVLIPSEMPPHQHLCLVNFASSSPSSDVPPTSAGYIASQVTNNSASYNYNLTADGTTVNVPNIGLDSVTGGLVSTDSDALSFSNYTSNYKASPHNNVPPICAVYLYIFCGVPVTV